MKQAVDPYASFRELTLRGIILGALITVIFTASNVYLGLKVGLTFASSIPAAVISMAVLKFFKGSNILENNMVQTQASAAGTLPVLAVGMGIYLPPSVNMPIVIGAVLAAVLKSVIARRQENREGRLKNAERIGTLFSAGLIVGESLIGVIMAFIIAFSVTNGGSDAPLALNLENWDTAAKWLGLAFFVFGMFVFARRVLKAGR
ncbi:hypothetical protein HMPREF2711_04740 [Neisseria sp. HMSC070A01]|nr:hypothetical protein HMPREF2711_04740 [Neisseria sp. HMSC070A01]